MPETFTFEEAGSAAPESFSFEEAGTPETFSYEEAAGLPAARNLGAKVLGTVPKAAYALNQGLVESGVGAGKAWARLSDISPRPNSYREHVKEMQLAGELQTTPERAAGILDAEREIKRGRLTAPGEAFSQGAGEAATEFQQLRNATPGFELPAKGAEMVGGMLPFVAEATVPIIGPELAATHGGLSTGGDVWQQAFDFYKKRGASDEEATKRADALGGTAGAANAMLFTVLPGAGGKAAAATLGDRLIGQPVARSLAKTGLSAAQAGGIMAADKAEQLLQAKQTYRPDLTAEQAAKEIGETFLSGAAAGAAIDGMHEAREFGKPEQPAAAQPDVVTKPAPQPTEALDLKGLQAALLKNQIENKVLNQMLDLTKEPEPLEAQGPAAPEKSVSIPSASNEEPKMNMPEAKPPEPEIEAPAPLTEPAKPETKDVAAPETSTGGTASGATEVAPKGIQERTGSPLAAGETIPAEEGSGPSRSAAAASARKSPGLTEEDGLLFQLAGGIGKLPAFLPDGVVVGQYRRLKAKFDSGGFAAMTPKERDLYRRLQEVFPKNYEDDFGPNGEAMRRAYNAAKKAGIAGELFERVKDARAFKLDQVLEAVKGATGRELSARDLWEHVERLSNAHAERVSGKSADAEAVRAQEMTRQEAAFKRDNSRPSKDTAPVPDDALQLGTAFTLKGARLRVTDIHFDQDGRLLSVTLEDGKKYGTQEVRLAGDHATDVRADAGSVKQPEASGIKATLDKWIEATDPTKPLRRGELQGGLALPKWLAMEVAHGALKAIRAAYELGETFKGAIEAGVKWLRDQKLNGFDEQEARAYLTDLARNANPVIQRPARDLADQIRAEGPLPEQAKPKLRLQTPVPKAEPEAPAGPRSYDELTKRLEEITKRSQEIATATRRPGSLTDELKSERYALAKESRDIQRQLSSNPDYVRDLILKMDRMGSDTVTARKAGNGAHANELGEQLRGMMEGELQQVPQKLFARLYNEMLARGEIKGTENGELPNGRTLGGLTAWLEARKLDSPKVSLRDRFQQTLRLADRWNAGKDALEKAADHVQAAWQVFKEQWKSPLKDTEFRALMKDWFYLKQWTGLETHRWVEAMRRRVPQGVRREAISIWVDAGGDEQLLRAQADMVPSRFKNVWETALKLTDEEKALGRRIRADFEEKLEAGRAAGLIEKGREHYGMPQVWKTAPKNEGEYDPSAKRETARNPSAKLDPRAPFFSLKRTNPSYFDGIMAGGIPKGLDVGKLVGLYNADFHNSLADRGVIKSLKDAKAPDGEPIVKISGGVEVKATDNEGGRVFFADSNRTPKDAVTKDGRPYRAIDHWALRDWKFSSKDAQGNPIILRGDFLVHPDYYKFLKNELSQSWLRDPELGGKYFNPVLGSAAFMKASKFASATFHLATIGEHAIFHGILPITRGVNLDPGRDPKLASLMRNGMELGFGHQRELFEEGLTSHGGLWGHVPGLGEAMTRASNFLFQDYIPKIKAKTGLVVLERNLKRYGGKLSDDQIAELTANQMNAAFGVQNWRLMGTSRTFLDVNRLLLTAPDFLLSRAKVVAQALKPYNREQRYFLMAQAATVYIAARALNMLFDDDAHWEPENALRVVYKGRSYGARFLVSDIVEMAHDPSAFAAGRLGPLPRAGIEAITGRDMRTGVRKDVPFQTSSGTLRAAQILVKDMAEWMIPVGAEGLLPGSAGRGDTKLSQVPLALLGVGSRKYTARTQIWQLAGDFNRKSSDPKTQADQKRRDAEAHAESAYKKLDNLLEAGELDQARKEYQSLLAEGKKEKDVSAHFDQVERPFTGNRDREDRFVASLTPAQRQTYRRAIAEREALRQGFQRMLGK